MSLSTVGRYILQAEVGRGGMATVYRAYDPRFKREVAVKILPPAFLHDPTFRARFEREAQTIAALEHPAIVPVYDYGEENGQPYLVMRLMTGGSLAEKLEQGPLTVPETLELLRRLAPALDRAHSLGIIHRDLKPGNILFDRDGHPHISDFGLAKLTESTTQLSQTGLLGTPAYMSPEQAQGVKQIDRRADLYALGAILYQMLTGKLPYEAETPLALAFKHVTEPPPHLQESRPDLPAQCDAVITQAMAKDPDQRFSSASQMVAALESALDSRASPAQVPETTVVQAVPPPPRASPPGAGSRESGVARPAPLTEIAPARPSATSTVSPTGVRAPLMIGGLALLGLAGLMVAALMALWVFDLFGFRALAAITPASATPAATIAQTPLPATAASPTGLPTPPAGVTAIAEVDQMIQVYVPAGEFIMGNDSGAADQRPAHRVYLDAFWIDRTEVTNARYATCVGAGGCTPPLETRSLTRTAYYGTEAFANHPVLFVTWQQAEAYCVWAGRRLPTEAEWEKAARGTEARLYPWGNSDPNSDRLNFNGQSGDTVEVGRYPDGASPYGALDLAGNAWEWVADWYAQDYYAVSADENPTGPAQTGCPEGDCRVLRGGAWDSRAELATTTVRLFYGPHDSRDAFTIRCAQTP